MVTSIELSEQELTELRELTEQNDSAEVTRIAVRDCVRYTCRMPLKQLSGEVEMIDVDLGGGPTGLSIRNGS